MGIRKNIVVALDVGTNFIKAALGEVSYGQDLNILGISKVPSTGLRKGNIIDIDSTAQSIDYCLNELERLTGIEVNNAVIGFSGVSIYTINNHAVVAVGNSEIKEEDKERVLKSALNIALPPDKTIIQFIERQYIVDGYDGIKDPVGMVGNRLEVEVTIIIAAAAVLQNTQKSTNRINLNISEIIYNPLLLAESVLLPAEKEMGIVVVDIGGGTIEIAVFQDNSLIHTSVLPVGGDYITKDLAIVLKTSLEEALKIKELKGVASPDLASDDITIDVHNIQGVDVRKVSQHVVADIIYARISEIAEMLHAELRQFGCLDKIPGGMVITGGGAQLAGIVEVMEELLDLPVRQGTPENTKSLPSEFNKPENAVVLGGIIYAANNLKCMENFENHGWVNIFNKISYWFKDLFR